MYVRSVTSKDHAVLLLLFTQLLYAARKLRHTAGVSHIYKQVVPGYANLVQVLRDRVYDALYYIQSSIPYTAAVP